MIFDIEAKSVSDQNIGKQSKPLSSSPQIVIGISDGMPVSMELQMQP